MNKINGMKVPVLFTSLLVIHPHRKVRSACIDGSLTFSRVFMSLYMVMDSRSVLKPSYTSKTLMGVALRMMPLWWRFEFSKRQNTWVLMSLR